LYDTYLIRRHASYNVINGWLRRIANIAPVRLDKRAQLYIFISPPSTGSSTKEEKKKSIEKLIKLINQQHSAKPAEREEHYRL